MEASRNIALQKQFYPELFYEYERLQMVAGEVEEETAVSIQSPVLIIPDQVVVVTTCFADFLKQLPLSSRMFQEINAYLENCHEVVIEDCHQERWLTENNGRRLCLWFHHGFDLGFMHLKLVHKWTESHSQKAAKVIFCREPDFFEQTVLRVHEIDVSILSQMSELMEQLVRFTCTYQIRPLIKTDDIANELDDEHFPYLSETPVLWFEHQISQEILNSAKTKQRQVFQSHLQHFIVDMTMASLRIAARDLLDQYINSPDFVYNYFAVQLYLQFMQSVERRIEFFWAPNLSSELEELIHHHKEQTELYLRLQSSGLTELGSWVEEQMKVFSRRLMLWRMQRGVRK